VTPEAWDRSRLYALSGPADTGRALPQARDSRYQGPLG
jgi:hypothetical protein